MTRPLVKSELAPMIGIPNMDDASQFIEISQVIPRDEFDFQDCIDMQLALNCKIEPTEFTLAIHPITTDISVTCPITSDDDVKKLKNCLVTERGNIRSILFSSLGAISVGLTKSGEYPSISFLWDRRFHDVVPLVATTVAETHRHDTGLSAADIVHAIWLFKRAHPA